MSTRRVPRNSASRGFKPTRLWHVGVEEEGLLEYEEVEALSAASAVEIWSERRGITPPLDWDDELFDVYGDDSRFEIRGWDGRTLVAEVAL